MKSPNLDSGANVSLYKQHWASRLIYGEPKRCNVSIKVANSQTLVTHQRINTAIPTITSESWDTLHLV